MAWRDIKSRKREQVERLLNKESAFYNSLMRNARNSLRVGAEGSAVEEVWLFDSAASLREKPCGKPNGSRKP